ncbi:MAG: hypothetical protein OYG31_01370 [Candidatus Kaiserbacteria bacterium]|nr:hypothetical protein [Candidatus Kaiserbacteria bacterium]
MRSLGDSLQTFLENKKNPTSQRAHLVQTICDTLFSDKDFKKILGQTRQFTVDEIRDIFDQARSWNVNPKALFWKLVREKQRTIKEQLKPSDQSSNV